MNIWLVSFFENTPFDDNQNTRFNSLAIAAHNQGHSIKFWSSTFRHNTKQQRFSSTKRKKWKEKHEVIYVKAKPYLKNISFARLYSHYILAKELIQAFKKEEEKPDVIFMAYPPISTAKEVSLWANKNRIPFILDIIDPWPEIFESHLFKNKLISSIALFPMRHQARKAFKNVSGITAISKQYINWSFRYKNDIPTQHFYPAIDLKSVRKQLSDIKEKEHKAFNIIYAGSLGYSYDIPTILEAANQLEEKYGNKIQFTIAGDGPQRSLVQEYTKNHQNLIYLGRISKEELIVQYSRSRLGMTQHMKGATQSVTYKLFDLLSCGLPVLNSLESEMKDIIIDNKVGLYNTPGNSSELSRNIEFYFKNPEALNKASENAIKLTEAQGDSEVVYNNLLSFIEKITKV